MTFGQFSEAFFILLIPFFFRRLGVKWMIAVGMVAWAVRFMCFAYGDADALLWMLFAGIILHEGSLLGIGFSIFVTAIASLNLILDFDMIEKGTEMGAPKYMEWYCAFGLLVTIVWLYIEILRLLGKLSSRN